MRFIRYSDRPLTEVRSFTQDGSDSRNSKPIGIWLSIVGEDGRDSWKDFCEANGRPLAPHRYDITIKDDARILRIQTAGEIDILTCTYGYVPDCREHEKSNPDYTRSAIC